MSKSEALDFLSDIRATMYSHYNNMISNMCCTDNIKSAETEYEEITYKLMLLEEMIENMEGEMK